MILHEHAVADFGYLFVANAFWRCNVDFKFFFSVNGSETRENIEVQSQQLCTAEGLGKAL